MVFILLVLALAVRFFGAKGVFYFGLVVCAGGVFEYAHLALRPLNQPRLILIAYIFFALTLLAVAGFYAPAQWLFSFLITLPLVVSLALWVKRKDTQYVSLQPLAGLVTLGLIYASIIPGTTLHLLLNPRGAKWFSLLLAVVFSGDVAAYLGGSLLGGPKLMPHISPNKTVSGAISGLLGSSLMGIIFVHVFKMPISMFVVVALSLLIGAMAQTGDLFESLLKRVANVKDSGHFLPGHGGVLDRLDGVYFSAPVILCVAHWFSR